MKQMQNKGIDFKGQRIYIGIDVHLRSWSVTAMRCRITKSNRRFPRRQPPCGRFSTAGFPAGSTLPVTKAASPAFPRIIPLSPAG